MSKKLVMAITAVWMGLGALGVAQDRATVQMRDGSKFEGRIEELTANGELFVRVSQNDQRRVPMTSVALIDKVGGASGLPDTEVREATGSQHLLLLTNGSSVKGQLVAIRGGQGSANENQARAYVFRAANGGEQSYGPEQVARVYLGTYPFAAVGDNTNANPSALSSGVDAPGAFHVPANGGWVNTGFRVRRGEMISFNTSGEVQLSGNGNDRSRSPGTQRMAPGAPMPTVNAGALIGRVGNSQPFAIGDQTSIPMPFDGILFLSVNDDERSDNAGEFVVSIGRNRR
ncbi:MAG TPA: hypothetical protein VM096_01135 [Vicinamibacterales bacterium]|nr:hypothetical protein [Vicinamibacterales bacterium]